MKQIEASGIYLVAFSSVRAIFRAALGRASGIPALKVQNARL